MTLTPSTTVTDEVIDLETSSPRDEGFFRKGKEIPSNPLQAKVPQLVIFLDYYDDDGSDLHREVTEYYNAHAREGNESVRLLNKYLRED